jgi:26S proteasome regulatory subunit N2
MLNDAVNYVRQGVLIASALICIQHTEATCPKVCDQLFFIANLVYVI